MLADADAAVRERVAQILEKMQPHIPWLQARVLALDRIEADLHEATLSALNAHNTRFDEKLPDLPFAEIAAAAIALRDVAPCEPLLLRTTDCLQPSHPGHERLFASIEARCKRIAAAAVLCRDRAAVLAKDAADTQTAVQTLADRASARRAQSAGSAADALPQQPTVPGLLWSPLQLLQRQKAECRRRETDALVRRSRDAIVGAGARRMFDV